eukprot:4772902-Amphidinium_carterae.6
MVKQGIEPDVISHATLHHGTQGAGSPSSKSQTKVVPMTLLLAATSLVMLFIPLLGVSIVSKSNVLRLLRIDQMIILGLSQHQ